MTEKIISSKRRNAFHKKIHHNRKQNCYQRFVKVDTKVFVYSIVVGINLNSKNIFKDVYKDCHWQSQFISMIQIQHFRTSKPMIKTRCHHNKLRSFCNFFFMPLPHCHHWHCSCCPRPPGACTQCPLGSRKRRRRRGRWRRRRSGWWWRTGRRRWSSQDQPLCAGGTEDLLYPSLVVASWYLLGDIDNIYLYILSVNIWIWFILTINMTNR